MAREIKFRALDEKRSTLFEVDANYFRKHVERRNDWFIGFNSTGLEVSEYEGKGNWRVFPIMQYTGLKDKNGVEIYEGDIIDHFATFGYVIFEDGMFTINMSAKVNFGHRQPLCYIDTSQCEVIGNVYENADLLTK